MSEDTTILSGLRLVGRPRGSPPARLYYYQGNFYWPMQVDGSEAGRIRGAIRRFARDNADKVAADRARPEYQNLLQLFDEQMAAVDAQREFYEQ